MINSIVFINLSMGLYFSENSCFFLSVWVFFLLLLFKVIDICEKSSGKVTFIWKSHGCFPCFSTGIHHFAVETQNEALQRLQALGSLCCWQPAVSAADPAHYTAKPVAAPVSLLVPIIQLVWVIYSYGCIELPAFFTREGMGCAGV